MKTMTNHISRKLNGFKILDKSKKNSSVMYAIVMILLEYNEFVLKQKYGNPYSRNMTKSELEVRGFIANNRQSYSTIVHPGSKNGSFLSINAEVYDTLADIYDFDDFMKRIELDDEFYEIFKISRACKHWGKSSRKPKKNLAFREYFETALKSLKNMSADDHNEIVKFVGGVISGDVDFPPGNGNTFDLRYYFLVFCVVCVGMIFIGVFLYLFILA